jgi:hypothetical protein
MRNKRRHVAFSNNPLKGWGRLQKIRDARNRELDVRIAAP